MRVPVKINYNNQIYNTIKSIKINDYDFLIVEDDYTFLTVDVIQNDGKPLFVVTNDIENIKNISEHILIEYIVEFLNQNGNSIDAKLFLEQIENLINSGINEVLLSCNLKIKDGNFVDNVISLLEYFDQKFKSKFSLNFEEMKSFKIGNNHYKKGLDENNELKIVCLNDDFNIKKEIDEDINEEIRLEEIDEDITEEDNRDFKKIEVKKVSNIVETMVFCSIITVLCCVYLAYLILDIM